MAGILGTVRGQIRLDVRQAVAGYAAIRAQNQQTVYAMRGAGDSFAAAGKKMTVAGAGILFAFGAIVKAAGEFERKMDFYGAVTDATSGEVDRLSKYTLQLAQDTIYSANEIADGIIELGKAGVHTKDIIGGIGEAMANLGAAGDIPLMESGQIITSTIQQYDLAASDAVRVTDLLAGAANASIADITDIGVSLKYVGGVANAAGLTFEDTATAISLLAKAGIRGSTAGTSLRQMIVSLGGSTKPAREALMDIGILTEDGTNKFYDQEGKLKSLSKVYQILQNHLKGYNQKERLAYLRTIFNNRALSAASILTREGAQGFKDMNREMDKTTAADVAAKRLDNLSGDIEILRGNLETLIITAGGPFQETARGWVQDITKLVQAFQDLDPETQKTILQIIAWSGVVLLAMGIVSTVIGVIFRFVASMKKMGAAIKLLVKLFGGLWKWIGKLVWILGGELAAALGISLGALAAIIALIAIWVTIWILAYKKIKIVRDAVNGLVRGLKRVTQELAKFIKKIKDDPKQAWEDFKKGARLLVKELEKQFKKIPGYLRDALNKLGPVVAIALGKVRDKFDDLRQAVVQKVRDIANHLARVFTLENVSYQIGLFVGKAIRWFVLLVPAVLLVVTGMIESVVNFFADLAPRVGYQIGFMAGRAVRIMIGLAMKMGQWALSSVIAVTSAIGQLPGFVAGILDAMVTAAINLGARFADILISEARRAATDFPKYIDQLPGRIIVALYNMAVAVITYGAQVVSKFTGMGAAAKAGLMQGISGLAGLVGQILDECISAIQRTISRAFEATRDFAGGMWEGFKDGLGIHSPSYIEEALFQITRTTEAESRKLKNNVARIQGISKRLLRTDWGVSGPDASSAAEGYRKLARDHAASQNRAGGLLTSAGKSAARLDSSVKRSQRQPSGPVSMAITNWKTGEGYLYGIAQDAYDDESSFAVSLEGMG